MKKKRLSKSLILPILLFLLLIFIPKGLVEKIKGFSLISIPFKSSLNQLKPNQLSEIDKEKLALVVENESLKNQMQKLRNILNQEIRILKLVSSKSENEENPHSLILEKRLMNIFSSIPAQVIFRSPNSLGSSIWLDVGEDDNKELKNPVVCRNSPVVIGDALIGAIDYVGKKQSRVRLITDAGLSPSVRVARGDPKIEMVQNLIGALATLLSSKEGPQNKNHEKIEKALKSLKDLTSEDASKKSYLAKGIIKGRSLPLWRSPGQRLKGIGFNYDFSDEEGSARDLATGKLSDDPYSASQTIVEVGDVLITTGYDGVFPANLKVGIVDTVAKLKEGDYYYELTAIPAALDLDKLDIVFVLPPQGYDPDDLPPLIGR